MTRLEIGKSMRTFMVLISLVLVASTLADDKTLNLFAWSEYVPQEVIDGYTKETGIKVNYETYASNEELISKLRAGGTKVRSHPAIGIYLRSTDQSRQA